MYFLCTQKHKKLTVKFDCCNLEASQESELNKLSLKNYWVFNVEKLSSLFLQPVGLLKISPCRDKTNPTLFEFVQNTQKCNDLNARNVASIIDNFCLFRPVFFYSIASRKAFMFLLVRKKKKLISQKNINQRKILSCHQLHVKSKKLNPIS